MLLNVTDVQLKLTLTYEYNTCFHGSFNIIKEKHAKLLYLSICMTKTKSKLISYAEAFG